LLSQPFAKREKLRLVERDFFLAVVEVQLGYPCRVVRVAGDHAPMLWKNKLVVDIKHGALRVHDVHRTAGGFPHDRLLA
jgi:hypothetical protein